MSNSYDRIMEHILHRLEQMGRAPVDRSTLLRDLETQGSTATALSRALDLLIKRGAVRQVGSLYKRVPASWPKSGPPFQR